MRKLYQLYKRQRSISFSHPSWPHTFLFQDSLKYYICIHIHMRIHRLALTIIVYERKFNWHRRRERKFLRQIHKDSFGNSLFCLRMAGGLVRKLGESTPIPGKTATLSWVNTAHCVKERTNGVSEEPVVQQELSALIMAKLMEILAFSKCIFNIGMNLCPCLKMTARKMVVRHFFHTLHTKL